MILYPRYHRENSNQRQTHHQIYYSDTNECNNYGKYKLDTTNDRRIKTVLHYDDEVDEYYLFHENQEPEDLMQLLNELDCYRCYNDVENAIKCIYECIRRYPDYFYLYYKASFLYKSMKSQMIETTRFCKMAIHICLKQRNRFWNLLLQGFLLELEDKYLDALNLYEKAKKYKTKYTNHESDLLFRIAMVKGDLHQIQESIDYFLQAFHLQNQCNPTNMYYLGMCYNNIGWCYRQLNDDVNSLKYYEMAMNMCEVSLFYTNKIKALKVSSKYSEAIECCHKALELTKNPKTRCEIYCELGYLYHIQRKDNLSIEAFEHALKSFDKFFFPYVMVASKRLNLSQHPIELLNEGITKCDDGLSELVTMRMHIHRFNGDKTAAAQDSRKLIQISRGLMSRIH
ncbi:hypothetical protein C9374_008624 [Naegleria lovaniensis]|uniref:Tetratricopeptide repeat protein n=1 Tax=Naegleria lovaniensis TaxID=51637 RepID=A0AA88GIJ2_NAELO|nr:uncharacterized protein C9374_008624 [Naegleria lovaniensis]KAG2378002.1 hypothetical protein C9374_008624 [Naegleria lovaniensis]